MGDRNLAGRPHPCVPGVPGKIFFCFRPLARALRWEFQMNMRMLRPTFAHRPPWPDRPTRRMIFPPVPQPAARAGCTFCRLVRFTKNKPSQPSRSRPQAGFLMPVAKTLVVQKAFLDQSPCLSWPATRHSQPPRYIGMVFYRHQASSFERVRLLH